MTVFRLKLLILLSGLILFTNQLFAQSNSLLWEITGNKLTEPSYLFGTIHIKDKRVFQWGDSVMICFNKCKVMAGELVLDKASTKEMASAIMMPPDTTLKMLLKRRDYKVVKKHVRKKYGLLYAMMINKIKPVYTSLLLMEAGKSKEVEEMEVALDQHLQNLAKEKEMDVAGLETIEEQLQALEVMPLKEQAQLLVEDIKKEKKNKSGSGQIESMTNAYLSQNLDSLYNCFVEQEMPLEMMESLLYKRNLNMLERMEVLMMENPTFVAVGAAHLPGEAGLIALLREKGYKVRPVVCKKD